MKRAGRNERRGAARAALVILAAWIAPIPSATLLSFEASAAEPAQAEEAVPSYGQPTRPQPGVTRTRPAAPAVAPLEDLGALKDYWQGRYRGLRKDEARLVETVRLATKEYADSNRRNYRRSGVRHFHRTNANEAKAELARVREQIAACRDDVVAAGGMEYWLDEVDDEPIDPASVQGLGAYRDDGRFGGKGAYAEDEETQRRRDEEADPSDGRNDLYHPDAADESDEPAAISDEDGDEGFSYEAWRRNREEYEEKREPEKHLGPGEY